MAHRIARLIVVVPLVGISAAVVVGLAAAQRAAAGNPCFHGYDIPVRSEAAETEIKVAPCAFAPTVAHVPVGATVTFFNGPAFTHLITGANAEWGSRDVELGPGQTVSYRFDRPGVYPYACALHPGMSGAIVVGGSEPSEEPQAPASASDPAASAPADGSGGSAGSAGLLTAGAGTAAGLLVGAARLWFATRRRRG